MDKLRKEYPDIAPTGPTHVRAVRYGDLMFMSGVTALGTSAYGKSIVDQAVAALRKIKDILEKENASMDDIVKLTTYVTNVGDYREFEEQINNVWAEAFNGEYPANSLIGVAALAHEGLSIEIEAVVGF